eukprot:8754216-Pyramimonas_sp.AAC.1
MAHTEFSCDKSQRKRHCAPPWGGPVCTTWRLPAPPDLVGCVGARHRTAMPVCTTKRTTGASPRG